MPARWKPGLVLLALSIAGPLQAQPLSAQGVLSRCASQAGSVLSGISALRKVCPGVDGALDQLGLTALLPSGWSKSLTAGGLVDLGTLLERYSGSSPSRPPRAAALRSIASALIPQSPPTTWAERLESWIKYWTAPLLHRLGQWLRSLGPGAGYSPLARAIIYCLAALLVAGAFVAAFALGGTRLIGRPSPARPRGGIIAGSLKEPAAQSGEPDWTSLRDHPAGILRLLIDVLTRSHRLERERHLTCRELEAQIRLDNEIEREGFVGIARLAERELYGPPGSNWVPEDTLRDVRALHDRLLAAGGAAQVR